MNYFIDRAEPTESVGHPEQRIECKQHFIPSLLTGRKLQSECLSPICSLQAC